MVEDATAAEIDAAVSGVAAGNGGAAAEDGGEFFLAPVTIMSTANPVVAAGAVDVS